MVVINYSSFIVACQQDNNDHREGKGNPLICFCGS